MHRDTRSASDGPSHDPMSKPPPPHVTDEDTQLRGAECHTARLAKPGGIWYQTCP